MRLRELKRRQTFARQHGAPSSDRNAYDDAVQKMVNSPRAIIENTNESRVADARQRRRDRRWGRTNNPLRELGEFLHLIGVYTDPMSTLSEVEQAQLQIPMELRVPMYYRCHTAFPGVPQGLLERAYVYVVERAKRIVGNTSRARSNAGWLGRWEAAIENEIHRRMLEGDLPAPAVRDGLKLSWFDIMESRTQWETLPPLAPQMIDDLNNMIASVHAAAWMPAEWTTSAAAGETATMAINFANEDT